MSFDNNDEPKIQFQQRIKLLQTFKTYSSQPTMQLILFNKFESLPLSLLLQSAASRIIYYVACGVWKVGQHCSRYLNCAVPLATFWCFHCTQFVRRQSGKIWTGCPTSWKYKKLRLQALYPQLMSDPLLISLQNCRYPSPWSIHPLLHGLSARRCPMPFFSTVLHVPRSCTFLFLPSLW